jgi:dinuclear metal center YbgI/SA1388 family protein
LEGKMLRRELESYLAEYLAVSRFNDSSLNGLQVEGRPEVRRIAVAVSACSEVFRKAAAGGADALIVHHGLFWKEEWPKPVAGVLRERLKVLLDAECSLFAYHLPLDAHPGVGNNAVAARALGLTDLDPFADYHGALIGWRGRFLKPIRREAFVEKLEAYYGHHAHVVPAGPERVVTAGIVSGGAAREAEAAVALGLDAYVTGERGAPATYLCREAGVTFAALGHYATERVGVRALAAHLEEKFRLETVFIEVENEA